MLGGYGIVGGHIPLAAGVAFASKYRGDGRVTLCFFGEGAVSIGGFHEGARRSRRCGSCPSSSSARTTSTRWARRSRARCRSRTCRSRRSATAWTATASSPTTCSRSSSASARPSQRAREQSLPTLVEVRTYRFRGHSMSDPGEVPHAGRARGAQEARPAPARARRGSRRRASATRALEALEKSVEAEVADAVKFADESPEPGARRPRGRNLQRPVRLLSRRAF